MPEDKPKPSRNLAKLLTTLGAFVLAAVLLFYSLRGIDWRQVYHSITHAKPLNLVLICLLSSVALFIRAFRWRILLSAEYPVPIPAAFWATAAGYFGNNFLPARAGELVRTIMISSRSPLSKTYVLTTAFAERAADGIALVVITGIVLIFLPGKTPWLADASRGFAAIGLTGVFIIALLPRLEGLAIKLIRVVPVSVKFQDKAIHLFEHSLRGLRAFHDWKRLTGYQPDDHYLVLRRHQHGDWRKRARFEYLVPDCVSTDCRSRVEQRVAFRARLCGRLAIRGDYGAHPIWLFTDRCHHLHHSVSGNRLFRDGHLGINWVLAVPADFPIASGPA